MNDTAPLRPDEKMLATRATQGAPAPCEARVEAQVAQGKVSPDEGVRRLLAALGAAQRRNLESLKAVHGLGDDVGIHAKLHLCRGAFAEASAIEEAVRSMRTRYGVAASPTISFVGAP